MSKYAGFKEVLVPLKNCDVSNVIEVRCPICNELVEDTYTGRGEQHAVACYNHGSNIKQPIDWRFEKGRLYRFENNIIEKYLGDGLWTESSK